MAIGGDGGGGTRRLLKIALKWTELLGSGYVHTHCVCILYTNRKPQRESTEGTHKRNEIRKGKWSTAIDNRSGASHEPIPTEKFAARGIHHHVGITLRIKLLKSRQFCSCAMA